MYDYGARFYMPDIGRWGVVDPLAEMYQTMSTYHMSGNNPIFYVDSNGMNYDDYGVDQNGNVSLIQQTDDNFDRPYVAKSDEKGNAVKDANGNAQKAKEGEGKENKDYVKVNKADSSQGSIISQLAGKNGDGDSYGITNNFTDARRVFQFSADNSRVEWSIGGFNMGTKKGSEFIVGTSHRADETTAPWDFGVKGYTYENNIYSGHTHPYSRYPQPHDLKLSNPNAYNFLYYTGVGNGERESYFMPFSINKAKDGTLKWIMKNGYGSVKLPNLIK